MTKLKELSRRDAIKLLGAVAGASALANLPIKWSKPELVSGVIPAHAQTSCVAVFLEILSADNELGISLIGLAPTPDVGILPDAGSGDGGAGSTLTWYCQPGCLGFTIFLDNATVGSVQITTLTNQFVLNFDLQNSFYDVMIDLASGAYAVFPDAPPSGCDWPAVPMKEKTDGSGGFWQK